MMRPKYIISMLFLCLLATITLGQRNYSGKKEAAYLQIGDKLPDLKLKEIIKYKSSSARISDFKGKWLILDLWGVNCKACIEAMPEMDNLQQQFRDKMQILMVTKYSKDDVSKLSNRNKIVQQCRIPSVVGDTVLSPLFPVSSYPSHIWVNPEGVIVYITSSYNFTPWIINETISGRILPLSVKNETADISEFGIPDSSKIKIEPGQHISWHSPMQGNLKSFSPREMVDPNSKQLTGLKAGDCTLLLLIMGIYTGYMAPNWQVINFQNRIIVESDPLGLLTIPKDTSSIEEDRWISRSSVCYELYMPGASRFEIFRQGVKDVEELWGYTAGIEKRYVRCLALVKKGSDSLLLSDKSGIDMNKGMKIADGGTLRLQNESISSLIYHLQIRNVKKRIPIVDFTGVSSGVNLEIRDNFDDLESMKEQLEKYGLYLEERDLWIDMFVIRDKCK